MDPDDFDRALASPHPKLAAWDVNQRDGLRPLSVFSLADGGARQAARRDVPTDDARALTSELLARGVEVGAYDSYGPFVWHVGDGRVRVWDASALVLAAEGNRLTSRGRAFDRADFVAYVAYAADDHVDRGVKAERRDGRRTTVLYHLCLAAQADPTYGRNELLMSSEWCTAVAAALAGWANARYVDEI